MDKSLEFLSHPNFSLTKHIKRVANISKKIYNEIYLKNSNKQLFFDISQLIALGHDFGKFSSFFQDYIKKVEDNATLEKLRVERYEILRNYPDIPPYNDLKDHSKISALFTYFLVKELISSKYSNVQDNLEVKFLPLIAFLVVKKHHGNIQSFENDLRKDLFLSGRKNGYEQYFSIILENINLNKIAPFYEKNGKIKGISKKIVDFKKEFMGYYESLYEDYKNFDSYIYEKFGVRFEDISQNKKDTISTDISINDLYYFLFLEFLYSIILDSDKKEASKTNYIEPFLIEEQIVNEYMKYKFNKKEGKMNELRNQFYDSVNKKSKKLDLEKNFYSITVPTGLGKTLASFNFAINLMNRIKQTKELNYTPRIIYALPFTTIIEQNHSAFLDVLTQKYPMDRGKSNNILLSHHHLTDIKYSDFQSEDDVRVEDALFYIENWDSQVIVTTFVQLFMSVINNRNRTLKRFHKISNSIIILDEIQTIPPKYYMLINKIFNALSHYFNTYFVFVTATKPLLVDSKNCTEVVEDSKEYFLKMDRIRLYLEYNDNKTVEEFVSELKPFISKKCKNKSLMVICNTIKSSKKIYSLLSEDETINKNHKLVYLSTNIIPNERFKRIKSIKRKPKGKIIITTQLVEAGVDIDVDFIFRDFAPLSSINQSSGRCNRNFSEKGEVHLITLIDERGREYSSYIYDNVLLDISKKIFNKYDNTILESDFLDISNEYFLRVHEKISSEHISSKLNIRNVLLMNLRGLSEDFNLIEENFERISLFIEVNNRAKILWKRYLKNLKEPNFLKRKMDFFSFKADFFKHVITVSKKDFPEFELFKKGFISYISNSNLGGYYDIEIGFTNSNIW